MKVTRLSGKELNNELGIIWQQLQQANPDLESPYFDPAFTRIISEVRRDVEIAVLESNNKIIGFFPFQREHRSFARAVGGIISDYHGLICKQDLRFSPNSLLGHVGLTAWDFDHLVLSQLSFAPFHWSVETSPQINVACGYSAYVEQRRMTGSEQIKNIYYFMRRLEREVGPVRFIADSRDMAALAAVLSWKSRQYLQTGKRDLFASRWIREAMDRIFETRAEGCSGILSLLFAGDHLVAGHFGMRSRQAWHYWFPSYNPKWAKYSPGLSLLLKMIEHAPTKGLKVIDLGKGMSPYKERFMNSRALLAVGRVESSWRSVPRKTWRTLRERLAKSPLGAPARIVMEWLR